MIGQSRGLSENVLSVSTREVIKGNIDWKQNGYAANDQNECHLCRAGLDGLS
jgi:hypothetical protein